MEERFNILDTAVFEQNQKQGGLVWRAPVLGAVCAVFLVSLIGLPGLGGFVGSALLLMGSFNVNPLMVLVCSGAILFFAYKVFSVFKTIFLGKADGDVLRDGSDLTLREKFSVAPLVLGLLVLGLYPKGLLELIRPTALTLLSMVK
jgi:NADH-quinone oxidoreductase subunit M